MGSQKQLEALEKTFRAADADYGETLTQIEALIGEVEARPSLRDICLRILSKNPKEHRVRLVLCKLFYLDGMGEHCVRELLHLQRLLGDNPAIARLLENFREYAYSIPGIVYNQRSEDVSDNDGGEEELAELDIDVDFGEAFEDLEDEEN